MRVGYAKTFTETKVLNDILICSILAVDGKIETEGDCPDFQDLES